MTVLLVLIITGGIVLTKLINAVHDYAVMRTTLEFEHADKMESK